MHIISKLTPDLHKLLNNT